MKKKVVVFNGRFPPDLLEQLKGKFDVTVAPPASDPGKFLEAARTAHGLIGSFAIMGEEQLGGAAALEVIASTSAGVDNYDLAYLKGRGIRLTNTPDVLTETTADLAFTLIMATARRALELAEFLKEGRWTGGLIEEYFGTDVHGKTLGIVGFGRIGQAIARRGHFGFGMKILYTNRSEKAEPAAELKAERLPLEELLGRADFVCVAVPLSTETDRLIGAREFGLMRADAIFVNIARGRVVDEEAMIEALRAGKILGAGLDVFEVEPLPMDSPLLKMKNVVALPHIGSATRQTRHAMAARAVENLVAVLEGGAARNVVL